MLVLDGVAVAYPGHNGTGPVRAVDGVDLTVGDGEIVCVLGPSGSGKSTLLRAIAGLEPLAAGRITRDGADLAGVPPHRRNLGLMFQDHALFPHRDVLGNVMFGLRARNVGRAAASARAQEVLALVGLAGFEHRSVRELSGGEQQRVALARALAPAPGLLMLDEPLGSLDRALRDRLVVELRDLLVTLGVSALFVTHDHDEAMVVADRVAIMHAGRVEQVGPVSDVWLRPATEFVARFLGWNVTGLLGPGPAAVRPDHLVLDPDGPLAGVVTGRTFRRDHFRLRVRVGPSGPAPSAESGSAGPSGPAPSAESGSGGPSGPAPSAESGSVGPSGPARSAESGSGGTEALLEVTVRGDDAPAVGAEVHLAVDPASVVRFPRPG